MDMLRWPLSLSSAIDGSKSWQPAKKVEVMRECEHFHEDSETRLHLLLSCRQRIDYVVNVQLITPPHFALCLFLFPCCG